MSTSTPSLLLLLLLLLSSLASSLPLHPLGHGDGRHGQSPNATAAVRRECKHAALHDRTVPYSFCFHILSSINTANPDLMAQAAMLWARARMHKIDVTLSELEKGVHKGVARKYSLCREGFGPVDALLSSAHEFIDGKKIGEAKQQLGAALQVAVRALGNCEGQLVGRQQLTTEDKRVETAIRVAVQLLH